MYRLMAIFWSILPTNTAEIVLTDGFFGKPIQESSDVFRNADLYPYRFHNVGHDDQPSSWSKRRVADVLFWDCPDSLAADKWFSVDDKDFSRVAEAIMIVFAIIVFAGLMIFSVFICKRRHYADSYSGTDCLSSDSECERTSMV